RGGEERNEEGLTHAGHDEHGPCRGDVPETASTRRVETGDPRGPRCDQHSLTARGSRARVSEVRSRAAIVIAVEGAIVHARARLPEAEILTERGHAGDAAAEIAVDRARDLAALGDRPHDQRGAAMRIARAVHAAYGGAAERVAREVAARIERDA